MRSLLVFLLGIFACYGCDIREASLVDMALDMEMPATICIRVLTKRTGSWALSNSFPEVWTAKQIREADLASDNTVVCLHNRTLKTEYILACRGTYCSLPMRKLNAIEKCTFTITEVMNRIDVFCVFYASFNLLFYWFTRNDDNSLPSCPQWLATAGSFVARPFKMIGCAGGNKDSGDDDL